jgi:hypothetical protein
MAESSISAEISLLLSPPESSSCHSHSQSHSNAKHNRLDWSRLGYALCLPARPHHHLRQFRAATSPSPPTTAVLATNLATEGLPILAARMTDAQYIRMEGKSSSVPSRPMSLTPRSPARRWIVTFRLHIGTRCSMHMTRERRPNPTFDLSPHFSIASLRTFFYRFGGSL